MTSPGRAEAAEHWTPGMGAADTGGGQIHAVGLAVFYDLGVAAGDGNSGGRERHGAMGADLGFEDAGGQAGFQNVGDDERLGARAPRDGEIVDGPR